MTQTIGKIKTFGDRISLIVAREGIDQQQFGIDVDATKSQVSRWANDKSLPKTDSYYHRIAEKYDYNFRWVKYGVGLERLGEGSSAEFTGPDEKDDFTDDPTELLKDLLDAVGRASIPSDLKQKFYQKLLVLSEQIYSEIDQE